ncbi:MAG: UDP-N-acetylmuramate dehydrogenase [Lachnospiraceae bacterium]|nr:UDP-N-acetylmuramate dehydrogenase [Lachnospiraceae bacterium]
MDWKETIQTIYPEGSVFFEEPMCRHTTFRIGGPAECYVIPSDSEQLRRTIALCMEQEVPYLVIGNGSNLLVSDAGIRGVVIRQAEGVYRVLGEQNGVTLFRADAGMLFSSFAKAVSRDGYEGMAYATGIPGTIGGAVFMNAGAYGGELKDTLVSVEVLRRDGEIVSLPAEALALSYRHSNVESNGYVVLTATFGLKKCEDIAALSLYVRELTEKRKEKQPLEYPSAGSTFKRPEGYFAGKLIDDAGLRGFRIGDAQVSEKHCGFVVNRGNATADEVMRLISAVQRKVYEQFGVLLEPEVRFLGF